MPRKFIKRHIPDAKQLHKHCGPIGILGEHLHRPSLWHLNRHSVARAFAIGLFCTWLPIPFQTIVAAFFAIVFCANLPLSVVLVFISNPVTMPAMFYFAYRLGARILGIPPDAINFTFSFEWLNRTIEHIWQPLLLGSLVLAALSAMLGYVLVRILWRIHIIQRWQQRKKRKLSRLSGKQNTHRSD